MPIVQYYDEIPTKHIFESEEHYVKAMERGEIQEGDEVLILGGDDKLKIDETLKMSKEGVLGVNTISGAVKDNTLPITSGGVYTEIGNIGVLLETI